MHIPKPLLAALVAALGALATAYGVAPECPVCEVCPEVVPTNTAGADLEGDTVPTGAPPEAAPPATDASAPPPASE